jgi:hypothetical protein
VSLHGYFGVGTLQEPSPPLLYNSDATGDDIILIPMLPD